MSHYGKFNQKCTHQILSESVSFCKRYDKTSSWVFWFTVQTAILVQNENAKFHKVMYRHNSGEVRWKNLHFCTTNLLRIICTKFYQNQSRFVEDMT